jgi:hypothetical protein
VVRLQGLLILALIIGMVIFFMPVILGAVIFFICLAALFILLARLGLLPGAAFKTYTFPVDDRTWSSPRRKRKIRFEDEERDWRESREGWYRSSQEGEEIILPETALKKEDGSEKN